MDNKKWSDLTDTQKAGAVVLGMIQIGLTAIALWDLQKRTDREVRGRKNVWRAVSFVNFVGPISYFIFGRKHGTSRKERN